MQLAKATAPEQTPAADETRRLVDAMAQELWSLYGRSGSLNWAGIDRHLCRVVAQARRDARDPRAILVPANATSRSAARPARYLDCARGAIDGRTGWDARLPQ